MKENYISIKNAAYSYKTTESLHLSHTSCTKKDWQLNTYLNQSKSMIQLLTLCLCYET